MPNIAVRQDIIEKKIYLIRGQRVMLDSDLAQLYGVETKYLTRQVRRNIERFPEDFMFQLTKEEFENLRSQFVTSKTGRIRGHNTNFSFLVKECQYQIDQRTLCPPLGWTGY